MKNSSKSSQLQEANQPQPDLLKNSRFYQIAMTFQEIMREYAYAITPAQLVVLFFIMDRTVGWGKRWEIITQRQFLNGIPTPDEDSLPYAGKLKMSLNTLKTALSGLIKLEVILERKCNGKHGSYTAYALNDHYFVNLPDEKKPATAQKTAKKSDF